MKIKWYSFVQLANTNIDIGLKLHDGYYQRYTFPAFFCVRIFPTFPFKMKTYEIEYNFPPHPYMFVDV